jgi:GT2 family glycosyltransferase
MVTVVIPTHDRGSLLERTLASVIRQSGVDLEVVVVDDGSTDDTARRIARFDDDRIRVVRNATAHGVSRARNRGIDEARGDWLAFCDDDDVWAPDKLASQLRAARHSDAAWVYTGHVNITLEDTVMGGARPAAPEIVRSDLARTNLIPGGGSNVLARAELIHRVDGFDTRLGILEDWDMWIRLARENTPAWVPRPLIGYRIHGTNSSRNIARMLHELEIIDARYRGPVDRTRFDRHLARVCLRGGERRRAIRFTLRAAARAAAHGDVRYLTTEFMQDVPTLAATFAPSSLRRRLAKLRGPRPRRQPDDWLLEAEAWLKALHRADRGGDLEEHVGGEP